MRTASSRRLRVSPIVAISTSTVPSASFCRRLAPVTPTRRRPTPRRRARSAARSGSSPTMLPAASSMPNGGYSVLTPTIIARNRHMEIALKDRGEIAGIDEGAALGRPAAAANRQPVVEEGVAAVGVGAGAHQVVGEQAGGISRGEPVGDLVIDRQLHLLGEAVE